MEIITGVLRESWEILNESAAWVLFGFLVAAIVKAFIPDKLVNRHLGTNGPSSVIKASLFGIPIPLCSCGVVPAAMGLRKQGAGKGATSAFLISTPETGVDSIAITWALMDPIMTVARPVAAFITSLAAGFLEIFVGDRKPPEPVESEGECSCSGECSASKKNNEKLSFHQRLKESLDFVFDDLLADVGKWLLVGIFLAGIVSYALPPEIIENYLGNVTLQMLLMLVIGIPVYVCATSSTPLAAAFILKGLSPGAALVFLLVGPATNMATMTVVYKLLGRRSLFIYLASIAVSSLGLGYLLNLIYGSSSIAVRMTAECTSCTAGNIAQIAASVFLVFLVGRAMLVEWLAHHRS